MFNSIATFLRNLSISLKINLTLALVFLYIISASLFFTARNEQELALHLLEQQTRDTADSYFDSVNTLMISGTMVNSGLLRQKILSRPGVTEARIVRGDAVKKAFGKGKSFNQALAGLPVMKIVDTPKGRILTVINSLKASAIIVALIVSYATGWPLEPCLGPRGSAIHSILWINRWLPIYLDPALSMSFWELSAG